MLTRLKVEGFKNLVDVDVRFGPFTCIAGANGVGKSNLFDAIQFLSALADRPFIEAAKSIRDDSGKSGDIKSLFHRIGDTHVRKMSFEVEMIVPERDFDDLGQPAKAGITFLRYEIRLVLKDDATSPDSGVIELEKEELHQINKSDAAKHILFDHRLAWRNSIVKGRRVTSYISTGDNKGERVIELHQDGVSGRSLRRNASVLPRTVLSSVYTAESPTVLLARREMQSWRLLQLEPTSLRKPDEFDSPTRLGADGSHLAGMLQRLDRSSASSENGNGSIYCRIANRLGELIHDVKSIDVEKDDKRQLFTLFLTSRRNTRLPARALSDGTLRFLALAALEQDPEFHGVLCLEEPENGIHPERIPAILRLLQDIAADPTLPVDATNPLRQIIINTHSPSVVMQVNDDDLLVAEFREEVHASKRSQGVRFGCLTDTWRAHAGGSVVSKGKLLAYLNPIAPTNEFEDEPKPKRRMVKDRPDMLDLFAFVTEDAAQ